MAAALALVLAQALSQAVSLPFPPGHTWYVCQSYVGFSHQGNRPFDIGWTPQSCNANNNDTGGRPITAPGAGTITFMPTTAPGNDFMCLRLSGGGSVVLGHVKPEAGLGVGSSVAAGEQVATVRTSSDPLAQNAGIAHLHFELWSGSSCYTGSPQAFTGASRMRCAPDLPYNATYGFYNGTALTPCEPAFDEVLYQASVLAAPASSDVDGDGRDDVCARASDGITCALSNGTSLTQYVGGPALTDASGWADPANFSTLRFGDVNGDGKADLCARSSSSLLCWPSTGAGFGPAIAGPALSNAGSWNQLAYYSTLQLADFDGDGRDDVCVRSSSDFRCYRSLGNGFAAAIIGPALSDAAGWSDVASFGTLRMGDLDGDGRADLCARSSEGIQCWRSTGAGFGPPIAGPAWSDAAGWADLSYWSTIRLIDMNGDRRADLCARTSVDFRCHLSTGSGFGPAIIGPALSNAAGWGDVDNYSTIRLGDVTGDGKNDLCARSNSAMLCWPFDGSSFGAAIAGPAWSDAAGWNLPRFYRTIRLADVNGDGKSDLCARDADRLSCWLSNGGGFPTRLDGLAWSDQGGWGAVEYYSTIRAGACVPRNEACNGRDDDCDRIVDEGCVDGGSVADAGLDAGTTPDAGAAPDAGAVRDGGEPRDAGEVPDAGVPMETGAPDAGGAPGEGGQEPSDGVVGGCSCAASGELSGALLLLLSLARRLRPRARGSPHPHGRITRR